MFLESKDENLYEESPAGGIWAWVKVGSPLDQLFRLTDNLHFDYETALFRSIGGGPKFAIHFPTGKCSVAGNAAFRSNSAI